jgi:fimbrial isopeptide formation D2 family protein/LPXTG-motif cell wall-anchored protein
MSHKTTAWRRRAVAATGVVALGFAGLLGASAAQADPVDPQPSFGDIIADATGSITVHKHQNQTGTPVQGDPAGPGAVLPNPIADVTFEAYLIDGANLLTNEGWTAINNATVSQCDVTGGGLSKGAVVPGSHVTDADGITTFENLSVGAYLLCETDAPANVATRAQPIIVTIPFPDNQVGAPDNSNGWLYDVHVYPKNTLKAEVTKSIESQTGFGLGSTVVFPITATIPRIPEGNVFTEFAIIDNMDGRLGSVKVDSVKIDDVDVDPAYYSAPAGNPLRMWFNQDGLAWLKGQGGKSVVVTVSGVVNSVGNGDIENTANYRITDAPGDTPPPVDPPEECTPEDPCDETPTVVTHWGDLKIKKVDSANVSATLQGAKFEVYAADNPYATDCTTTQQTGSAISVNGSTQFESDANGIVNIAGLFVSDSVNPTINAANRCYWIQEVQAPAGFVLPSDVWTPIAVEKGQTATHDVQITNAKTTVPELPLTGAQGQLFMVIGGIALITVGAALTVHRRRVARR